MNGYNDWFLPSKDELNVLYQNRTLIGGFSTSNNYWSSSEYSEYAINEAWGQNFATGAQSKVSKSVTYIVRAVRYF